jgi:hypothetical protein
MVSLIGVLYASRRAVGVPHCESPDEHLEIADADRKADVHPVTTMGAGDRQEAGDLGHASNGDGLVSSNVIGVHGAPM